tara:strand:+ start:979 stop:2409 length:1431 start_codon:yes stop_codon:yes gene_type:complete
MTAGWDVATAQYPLPPQNGVVVTPFTKGVHDIRWDSPALLAANTAYSVVGVNVYRSDASDRGPFHRLNEFPLGGTFFRDRNDYQLITKEVVDFDEDWIFKGDKPNDRRWQFRTKKRICKASARAPYDLPVWGDNPRDVRLFIDGVEYPVHEVFGRSGEVTLINVPEFNEATEKLVDAMIPTAAKVVEVTYRTPVNHVPSGVEHNVWYRLTTVVLDPTTLSGYSETPLGQTRPLSLMEVEARDWIWDEAVRRNQWILGCGGERVYLFVRKVCGVPCDCTRDPRSLEFHKQPSNTCLICYGTGYIGGYEGPYDIIVAPDDGERRIQQTRMGRRKEHTYEVWTGPYPLLTMRDFIVKQTNERFSIGAVRRPTHRGNLLQQHFQIGYFDEGDIRYRVPIDGTDLLAWPETRPAKPSPVYPRMPVTGEPSYDQADEGWAGDNYPEGETTEHPLNTEKKLGEPTTDDTERRGRTKVWENTNY